MSGRSFLVPMSLALVVFTVSCAGSPEDQTASLCEDLVNLAATVELIANPPVEATVGDVRGATEKLDPTIHQAERASVVQDEEGDALRADQEAVLDALDGIGDDTPLLEIPPDRLAPTDDLAARYRTLVVTLGCAAVGAE